MDSEHNQLVDPSDNGLEVFQYNTGKHESYLKEILDIRGLSSQIDCLPDYGVCVFLHKIIPVSFVFLRTIEGGSFMMDSMVTNPSQSPQIRNEANDMMVKVAMEYAKKQKAPSIIAVSKDLNTIIRARSHGFALLEEYQVIVASLLDKEP